MNFGEKIKALRKAKGLSQQNMADALGIAQTYVSSIEKRTDAPAESLLVKIAQVLGVSCDSLLSVNEPKNYNNLFAAERHIDNIHAPKNHALKDFAIKRQIDDMRRLPLEDDY